VTPDERSSSEEPATLLESRLTPEEAFLEDWHSRIWITYRRGKRALGEDWHCPPYTPSPHPSAAPMPPKGSKSDIKV